MKLKDVRQLPLWAPHSDWRPKRVSELPSWAGAKRVGLDIETKDPDLKALGPGEYRPDTLVAGFSFSIEDGPTHYVPMRHEGGDNVEDPEAARRYLCDMVRDFRGEVVGANLGYDVGYLTIQEKVDFSNISFFRDVQIADPLINELHMRYSLDAIAQRWGMVGKDEALLREAARHYGVDPKSSMWRLPARYVGRYAEQDTRLPLQLLRRQEKVIERDDLWEVFNLESQVQRALMRVRQRGIRISEERLEGVEIWSLAQEAEALAKIASLTGVRIAVGEVWQAAVLAPALTACGVNVPTTNGRGGTPSPSIDKNLLKGLQDNAPAGTQVHEVAKAMSWARRTNKLRTTFAASIRRHMVNGRVRCTYNQLRKTEDSTDEERGAAYGRLSSENPNLQQQPSRDEFATMWRSIYLPEEGAIFASCDFSQQEPRVLCHYADVCGLEGAGAAAQRYRDDPTIDNHQMMADMTGVKRSYAKELLLGRSYGMGGAKMCRKLNLPTRFAVFYQRRTGKETVYFERMDEAQGCARETEGKAWEVAGAAGQAILDQFDGKLPFIKALAKKCEKVAQERGYIKTLSGRRCRFPREGNKWGWTHKALNRLIQGSSADQTKKAVVDADAAGHFVQIQVHDEIDGSFGSVEEAIKLAEVMRDTYRLRVPMKVDVEVGPSWGEAKKIDRCVI